MNTLYVSFPACWALMVAGFLASRLYQGGLPACSGVGKPQRLRRRIPERILQHCQGAAGSSEAMEDPDSTEVKYKVRQWSLPGATLVPVRNVSSRVFWLGTG